MRCDTENSEEQTVGQKKLPTIRIDVVPMTIRFHGLGDANPYTRFIGTLRSTRDRQSGCQETNAAVDNNWRYHSKHLSRLKGQGSVDTTGTPYLIYSICLLWPSLFLSEPRPSVFSRSLRIRRCQTEENLMLPVISLSHMPRVAATTWKMVPCAKLDSSRAFRQELSISVPGARGKQPRTGFSLTGGPVVTYAQKQENTGFFSNVTTVLRPSAHVGNHTGVILGQRNHPLTPHWHQEA